MASLNEIMARFKRRPTDAVGIEVTSTAIRAVHMIKDNAGISLVGAHVMPAPEPAPTDQPQSPTAVHAVQFPPAMRGKYACLTVPGDTAIIKQLTFPGHFNEQAEAKIVESLGVENPDSFRISYKLLAEGHGKSESRILAVALPNTDATSAIQLFPAGIPAPFSLELSPLAVMTAFFNATTGQNTDSAIGLMDFGDNMSTFSLFSKEILVMIRRFDVGTNTLLSKIQDSLGVDRETAQGIISDGSFDISQSVSEIMEPLIKQLIVSRDFVERRENCHVGKLFVSGGLTVSRDAMEEMHSAMGLEVTPWDTFANMTLAEGAVPEALKSQTWMFAAAVGACLGTFEEAT